jgi:hypothetical protein
LFFDAGNIRFTTKQTTPSPSNTGRVKPYNMAVTKEQALDHIAEVYEYTLSLPGGPSHILSRELATWMQRHWAQAGANAATDKRRAKNTASKQATAPAPAQSDDLKNFVHPKSPKGRLGEKKAPSNAVEIPLPVEAQQEQPRPQSQGRQKSQSPVAADESETGPLSESEKEIAAVMKPRAILGQFGETRILATLKALNVPADEMPDSVAQMAAMMKQLIGKK